MNTPTLTLNGKKIEMPRIKANLWGTVANLVDKTKGVTSADSIENYCAVIAVAFGVEKEDVLNNLYLDEVIPKYTEVLNVLTDMLYGKLDKKNVETEIAAQA